MKFINSDRNIIVVPRIAIDNKANELKYSHAFISIFTPGDKAANISKNSMTENIKAFCFDDLDVKINEKEFERNYNRKIKMFDKKIAKDIIDFYNSLTCKIVIVHCDAGVSRSPAIAAALTKINNEDDSSFFKNYRPNMFVYRTMLKVFYS